LSFTKIKSEKRLLSSFGNFNSCEYPDISYTVSLSLLCVCVSSRAKANHSALWRGGLNF